MKTHRTYTSHGSQAPASTPHTSGQSGTSESPFHSASNLDKDDPHVIAALQEYLSSVEAGRKPVRAEFLARFPAVSHLLADCLDAIDFVHSAAAELSADHAQPAHAACGAGDQHIAGCLGDFRLLREVGRGGMGIVYEAEQISLARRVALKVLPFAAMTDSKQLQRFQNEAHAAAQLHHQNIVPVYFVGHERGVHYYAMQFIEGHTLADLIRELQRVGTQSKADFELDNSQQHDAGLTPTAKMQALSTARTVKPIEFLHTVARLGIEAAEALDHAHQVGIIHRDIKPSNLLLDVSGRIWITDFGLARILALSPSDGGGTRDGRDLTLTGDLIGTLRYMSPEQALAKRAIVDHRTDIYSLAATLYELLTLRPVFAGLDRQEILRQITFDEPTPPRKVNVAISAEFETILLKAMAKNPAERYGTAQELADDLKRHLEDKPILARRPGPVRRLAKWSSRHRPIVWSAAAATLAAFAVLAASIGWIINDRNWRQVETDRQITRAIHEAEQLMRVANWMDARTSLSRADGLLLTSHASNALRHRAHRLHADLQMLLTLDSIREDDAAMLDGAHDYHFIARRYKSAFREYGIDLDELDVDRAASEVNQRLIYLLVVPRTRRESPLEIAQHRIVRSILGVGKLARAIEHAGRVRFEFDHPLAIPQGLGPGVWSVAVLKVRVIPVPQLLHCLGEFALIHQGLGQVPARECQLRL